MTLKISAMTPGTTPAGTEPLASVQGGNTRSLTVSQIALLSKTLAQLSTQISDAVIARTDAGQTFTGAQVIASIVMGGNTLSDVLVASDGVSASDLAVATAGYIDALYIAIGDAPTAHDLDAHGTATLAELNAVVSDATLARTDATQTFTGAQNTNVTTLTYAATIAINALLNNAFKVTLTAAGILGNPSGPVVAGMSWTVEIIQGGAGTFALTFASNYVGPASATGATPLDTTGDATGEIRLLSCYAVSATKIIVIDMGEVV